MSILWFGTTSDTLFLQWIDKQTLPKSLHPKLINSGSDYSEWSPLDATTKARLSPFLWQPSASPGSFTFGPDNIWQPCTSRRFCLNLLSPLGADTARQVAPNPFSREATQDSPNPQLSPDLLQPDLGTGRCISCGLLLIIHSHSWQTAPAVMILWDCSRPFETSLSGQLFGVHPRTGWEFQTGMCASSGFSIIVNRYSPLVIALIFATFSHGRHWIWSHIDTVLHNTSLISF